MNDQAIQNLSAEISRLRSWAAQLEGQLNKVRTLWQRNNTALEQSIQGAKTFDSLLKEMTESGLIELKDDTLCVSPRLQQLLSIDWSKVFTTAGGLRKKQEAATVDALLRTSQPTSESPSET